MEERRTELAIHTDVSEDRSVISLKELFSAVSQMGLGALAITDLNSVQAFTEAVRCSNGFRDWDGKLIFGAQVCYEKEGRVCGVSLLARNNEGIRELNRILSSLRRQGKLSLADRQVIRDNRKNLLVGALSWTEMEELQWYDYIAVIPATRPEEQARQKQLCAAAREKGILVAAVSNCHYLSPREQPLKEHLDRIMRRPVDMAPAHLYTTRDMLEAMSYLGQTLAREVVITAPDRIAEQVEAIEPCSGVYDTFSLPDDRETVHRLCREKMRRLYGENLPKEIVRRFESEVFDIDKGQHWGLYLLTHYLVKEMRSSGNPTGFRGGLGSSLVAWLLDITDVNPLPAHYRCPSCRHTEFSAAASGYDLPEKNCPYCGAPMEADGHNIPHETFLSTWGDPELPMDINVPGSAIAAARQFIPEYLGEDRVALAGWNRGFSLKRAEMNLEQYVRQEGITLSEEEKCWLKRKLSRTKTGDSEQSFGLMLLPEGMEWEDITPLRTLDHPEGRIRKATHVQFYELFCTLAKVNILEHTVLERVKKLFALTGVKPEEISYRDPEVYRLFRRLDTEGLPEFDTDFTKDLLTRVEEINFGTLVKICAMAHGTNVWNENGEALLGIHPFEQLIATRDDVFQVLCRHGVDRDTAHAVMTMTRKGKFRRENYQVLWEELQKTGVPDWYLESMGKVFYLFPKAHAACYVKLALALAWFKVYYPEEFWETAQ